MQFDVRKDANIRICILNPNTPPLMCSCVFYLYHHVISFHLPKKQSTDSKMTTCTITFVKIPEDKSKPLKNISVDLPTQHVGGDQMPNYLKETIDQDRFTIEAAPLKRMAPFDAVVQRIDSEVNLAGVYAYHYSSMTGSELDRLKPNVRATCLSMACGLHSQRFYGDVFISRLGYFSSTDGYHLTNQTLTSNEIQYACATPDLRIAVIQAVDPDASVDEICLPQWLTEAAKANYEDAAALSILASVMKQDKPIKPQSSSVLDSVGESGYESDSSSVNEESSSVNEKSDTEDELYAPDVDSEKSAQVRAPQTFVTKVTLCLQCRQHSNDLCPHCEGMYFCASPRACAEVGWSHQSICKTWAQYIHRRDELGTFPFDWHLPLLTRENQISEEPYRRYLTNDIGVLQTAEGKNWWLTETSGWSGGQSESAKEIDVTNRLSYAQGFAMDGHLLPPERSVSDDDVSRAGIKYDSQCNLLDLNSWEDYYKIRCIPLESPAALLLSFPLSIYYALLKHGAVPITVARMLRRQVRIHVVGIEKELNFLDMFKELGYLLPDDLSVSITCNFYSIATNLSNVAHSFYSLF